MATSIFLAKVIGVFLVVTAVSVFLNRKTFLGVLKEFVKTDHITVFSGGLALMIGLLIVFSHNLWVVDWRILITIFGWGALAKGVVRFVFPEWSKKIIGRKCWHKEGVWHLMAIVCLILGLYLLYVGFGF